MEKLSPPMGSLGDSTPKASKIPMHLLGARDHKLGRKNNIDSYIVNSATFHVHFTRATPSWMLVHVHKDNSDMRFLNPCMCVITHQHHKHLNQAIPINKTPCPLTYGHVKVHSLLAKVGLF